MHGRPRRPTSPPARIPSAFIGLDVANTVKLVGSGVARGRRGVWAAATSPASSSHCPDGPLILPGELPRRPRALRRSSLETT